MSAPLGVHSEVWKLKNVMVSRPGLAHERLTPSNCNALLFDDVFWVDEARKDHSAFCDKMRDRGVELLEQHDLLTEILDQPEARTWLLDRKITEDHIGVGMMSELREWLNELPAAALTRFLTGALRSAISPLPRTACSVDSLAQTALSCSPCRTSYSRGTHPAGSTGASH
ncbi:arginine deiminase family protein [Roseobacter sp.]|uniref:arginine deiminase family protein n=1 Tax=Roseobacter sp. TaxID=1907202 RepID=UPI00385962B3